MGTIIQIIGLPGSGKTSLALALKERINAVHLNADEIRKTVDSDLGFSIEDRVEHARRMGAMARLLASQGLPVIVDFVCPTHATRRAFGKPDVLVWLDRIEKSVYEDTNQMWQPPDSCDMVISRGLTVDEEADLVVNSFRLFDWKAPTALILGRWQPWHAGHRAVYEEARKRAGQVMIGVRNTHGTSGKDPLTFEEVCGYIHADFSGKEVFISRLPNITNIVYGRDVGYKVEQVSFGKEIEAISATQKRKDLGIK
jgi:hypothetical protein